MRTVVGVAALAVTAAGLGVGGTALPAKAQPGVFTTPGTITTFAPPSHVAGHRIGIEAIGGAGEKVGPTGGAHGARLYAEFNYGSGQTFQIEVGRRAGAGGAGSGVGNSGGDGGGQSHVDKCAAGCFLAVIAGGAGGDGGDAATVNAPPPPPFTATQGGTGGAGGTGALVVVSNRTTDRCAPGQNGDDGQPSETAPGGGGTGGQCVLGRNAVTGAPVGAGGGSGVNGGSSGSTGFAGGAGGDSTGTGGAGGGGGAGYHGGGGGGDGTAGTGGGGGGAGASAHHHSSQNPAFNVEFETASVPNPSVKFLYRPSQPQNVEASPSNNGATVFWVPPADQGGAATVTGYKVQRCNATGGSCTQVGSTGPSQTSFTDSGLTNGQQYSYRVVATNSMGDSDPSAASNAATPSGVPDAPAKPSATAGDQSATISWTPPANNGSPITSYTVRWTDANGDPASKTVDGSATSTTITGLTNGQAYQFTVEATNANGTGPASPSSDPVTPGAFLPGKPAKPTATAGNQSVTVSWTPPANSGPPISSYTVRSTDNSVVRDVEGSVTSVTITGLTNGQSYQFTVEATNVNGTGPASDPSDPVTPNPTAPGAPTNVTATPGNGQVTVAWSPPANDGGSAITSYTVTSQPGGRTTTVPASQTSATQTGLTNGVTYSFTVRATNGVGTGPASSAVSATPQGPTVPGAPTGVNATPGNASATVSWTAPSNTGGSGITRYHVTTCPTNPAGACTTQPTTGAGTSFTVTGLTNGTSYVFRVAAENAQGIGAQSQRSNEVTPSSATVLYSQSWDSSSNAGWTPSSTTNSVRWRLTSACAANHGAPAAGFGWYYGNTSTCTYNNGSSNTGSLTSPLINTGSGPVTLNVWSKRKVESCSSCSRDQTRIEVKRPDGTWSRVYYRDARNPSTGQWELLTIPNLQPVNGKIQIRFRFITSTSANNNFYGWAIDEVVLKRP